MIRNMLFALLCSVMVLYADASAKTTDTQDEKLGVYEQLGEFVDLDLSFTNQYGETKTLREFMGNKPTIISMNYYNCPGICSTQFAAMAALVDMIDLPPEDFQVLTISIEPEDTPQLARDKQETFFKSLRLKKNFPRVKWQFLVGEASVIKTFSQSIGYYYKKQIDDRGNVFYLHPGALTVISPSGKITRHIYGLKYPPFDVKMGVIEAAEERVGGIRITALKYCFAYDSEAKKYVFQWEKVVGVLMFLILGTLFVWLVKTGRKDDERKLREFHEQNDTKDDSK